MYFWYYIYENDYYARGIKCRYTFNQVYNLASVTLASLYSAVMYSNSMPHGEIAQGRGKTSSITFHQS